MITRKVKVNCPIGIQAKPAGMICDTAQKYNAHIAIEYADGSANAKSMLSILGAVIKDQELIELICDGVDEIEAMADLVDLLENRLAF